MDGKLRFEERETVRPITFTARGIRKCTENNVMVKFIVMGFYAML